MTAYFLIQFLLLQADWLVSVVPTPCVDAPHRAAEPVGGGLAFDNPFTSPRTSPEMGEPEKIERTAWFSLPPHWGLAKIKQSRLLGVKSESELGESLR